jgi:hypothetical protein
LTAACQQLFREDMQRLVTKAVRGELSKSDGVEAGARTD